MCKVLICHFCIIDIVLLLYLYLWLIFFSILDLNRAINIIHDSEHPVTTFALLDTGTCLMADLHFDMLMSKMGGIYIPKKATKIESKGPRYEVQDFIIKLGSVSIGPSFRGILVEVMC